MSYKNIFARYETKYIITPAQQAFIRSELKDKIRDDEYGKSLICNLYYDTPDFRLIRRSIEKPVYKEKLRVRSYGAVGANGTVFAEIKKKYEKTVYKRREAMTSREAQILLEKGLAPRSTQIIRELNYARTFYGELEPRMFISYNREAFFGVDDPDFRLTFDTDVIARNYDLTLAKGAYGTELTDRNTVLMEIKTGNAIPFFMLDVIKKLGIYPASFSKYGAAYTTMLNDNYKGGLNYA